MASEGKKSNLINREISWLSFDDRVLQEAADVTVPLKERIRFLGIYSNNLDEFFRIRYATIKRIIKLKLQTNAVLGGTPKQILKQINAISEKQRVKFNKIFGDILKDLAREDIYILNDKNLNKQQTAFVKKFFADKVKARLTPILIEPKHDFPALSDNHIYLVVECAYKKPAGKKNKVKYAIVDVPTKTCPRFVVLPKEGNKNFVIMLEDVIKLNLQEIFHPLDFDSYSAYGIKVTRDAELDLDFDLGINKRFVNKVAKSLKKRALSQPVRLTYDDTLPKYLLEFLKDKIKIDNYDSVVASRRYLNFKDFSNFPDFGLKHLRHKKNPPLPHRLLSNTQNIFSVIAHNDVLIYPPYQSLSHVTDMLREAAVDPHVKEIQIILYRVARDSVIVETLLNALKNGKRVTVAIEIQARFDEARNIHFSDKLTSEGAKVIYGIKGYKVHGKLLLITRKEHGLLNKYAYMSTGNFNEETSKTYTDIGFFTSNRGITKDVENIFDFLKDTSQKPRIKNLLVSPFSMRSTLTKLIDKEIKFAKRGFPAEIILKLNSLVDYEITNKLYQASQAGVKIKMLIRGICSIIPGEKDLSENISGISVIDKYLEHSRVYAFANGGSWKYYISSADWMTRNFDNRVEVAVPIYDMLLQKELRDILNIQLSDNVKARILDRKGDNHYRAKNPKHKIRQQIEIYNYLKKLNSQIKN